MDLPVEVLIWVPILSYPCSGASVYLRYLPVRCSCQRSDSNLIRAKVNNALQNLLSLRTLPRILSLNKLSDLALRLLD